MSREKYNIVETIKRSLYEEGKGDFKLSIKGIPLPKSEGGISIDSIAGQLRHESSLAAENVALRFRNTQLDAEVALLKGEIKKVRERSAVNSELLRHQITQLTLSLLGKQQQNDILREENERLKYGKGKDQDRLDPKGYCRTLGLDPKLLHSLPQDRLEAFLGRLYKAYAQVLHSDHGGSDVDMKGINEAYDFLKDPHKRISYGKR